MLMMNIMIMLMMMLIMYVQEPIYGQNEGDVTCRETHSC